MRPETGTAGTQTTVEKSQVDDRSMGKPRGWLNWLSLGMLGAGGTEDSSQFSGVISDDVVKVFFLFSLLFFFFCDKHNTDFHSYL